MRKQLMVLLLILITIVACKKGAEEYPQLFQGFVKPSNFPDPIYNFDKNPVTAEGFELGKKLFYDPILSRDNSISCGSCHIQPAGFTHHGHDVSHGIDDRLGVRNSMPIMNLAWSKDFFWDGGVFDLDLFSIAPIENEVEMDEKIPNVIRKLNEHAMYPSLFEKAFGEKKVTTATFLKALSQFMVMAISSNSKYDKVMRSEGEVFSTDEKRGYVLYQEKCASCHVEPMFTDYSFRDNGLGPNHMGDEGRYEITLNPADRYKFRVPSLRNLKFTAPFMHDGRLRNLQGVFEHYRHEMKDTPGLDPIFKNNEGAIGISMTDEEERLLTAFLMTLNDEEFVRDKRFSEY